MPSSRRCARCGAPLEADSFGAEWCPACMDTLRPVGNAVANMPTTAAAAATEVSLHAKPLLFHAGQHFGAYVIDRPLGKGGVGEVYEAHHVETGRQVAVKILVGELDGSFARDRFLREGRLAAAVNHPNMVYIYGNGEVDGTPFILMELVRGGTLKEAVQQKGPMPGRDAVAAVCQVIAGLDAA